MGKTEERLRDAAVALGSTLGPADIPPLRLPQTSARDSRWQGSLGRPLVIRRWLSPLAAAASVATVIGVLVLIGSLPGPAGHRIAPHRGEPAGAADLRTARQHGAAAPWAFWQISGAGSSDLQVTAITASSPTSAWAFASDDAGTNLRPVAWRLTGSAWTAISFPGRPGERIVAAQASSPANVWALTSDNRALRWNGSSWQVVSGFPARDVGAAAVISRSDVWVFGQLDQPAGTTPATWHYNGHDWTRVVSAAGLGEASALSPDDIWADGGSVVAHWNGARWTRYSVASLLPPRTQYCGPAVTGIDAVSAADAWAVGFQNCQDTGGLGVLLHYAGGSWHRVASLGDHDAAAVLPDGRGGLWIPADIVQGTDGTMFHFSDGRLTTARLPLRPDHLHLWIAAAAPHGAAVFAGGAAGHDATGVVLRHDT